MRTIEKNAIIGNGKGTIVILCGVIFSFLATVGGCKKLERIDLSGGGIDDRMYPTTIYSVSEGELLQMRNDFAQRNPYFFTSLNQFGFCATGFYVPAKSIPAGSFTKEEAIAAVKEFVARNPEYTGVSDTNDLHFKSVGLITTDGLRWKLVAENQTVKGIEVEWTDIVFHTKNRAVEFCNGNHFPYVYVPKKFKFDAEQAKSQLLGKEIFHYNIGGQQYSAGFVTTGHLQQSTTKLIIVPIKTDDKIELRVAWQIYLGSPLHYIFEIDVKTGEIIREMPTIIS